MDYLCFAHYLGKRVNAESSLLLFLLNFCPPPSDFSVLLTAKDTQIGLKSTLNFAENYCPLHQFYETIHCVLTTQMVAFQRYLKKPNNQNQNPLTVLTCQQKEMQLCVS